MKRRTLFILFSVAFIVALGATPLTVSWIDGRVEKKNGSNWVDLNMGDRLDSASTVRLGPGATAEFVAGERRISLTASGVFVLDSLLKRGTEGAERRSGMLDKLAALVDPTARTTDTTVAGVRGNLIGDQSSGDMTWESDNADVDAIMTSAQQLVRDKHYAEAAEKFGEAAAAADGDKKDNATYGQAWALAANGQTAESVKILRGMSSSGVWAGPRALLLARLDIDSGAPAEARSLLQSALDGEALAGDDIQLAKGMIAETDR
ncbi:MAG: tetratricopeptide repeat protein [Rectinemataceae bacterium]